ncbi:MAG TPA: molybdopterin-dependent oxidoreductase [Acidimicrobiia bacterium]|nr:molybdopterin-dependent oxidoreductase [Acidimicrobiia bacterium]
MPHGTDWEIQVNGLVSEPRTIVLDELFGLEQRQITLDIHCVTSWTRFDSTFTGVPLAELLDPVAPGRFVSFAARSHRGHHTSLPLRYALDHSWVVHSFEGHPLASEHGGPVRIVTPGKYFYKSIKWLRSMEVLEHDRLGWWEANSAYHNNADPARGDERFTSGSVRPEQLTRFLAADRYDKYRGRVMIGLDLRAWMPASTDLRRLYLKNCDLSGVDLSGADLRESNLSLSRLVGANLAGADLSGSDLEGADFSKSNLKDADLSDTALSAARFDGADVSGSNFDGSWGLLEGQHVFLVSSGVSLPAQ